MSRYTKEVEAERQKWRALPRKRPEIIDIPGPGQESVWDYPRPPRVECAPQRVRVEFGRIVLAESTRALRVVETASPPVYYFPPADVQVAHLEPVEGSTLCEWKGFAQYWSVCVKGLIAERAAWSYPDPDPEYSAIEGHFAFFPGKMDACYVGDERVMAQEGGYYGGWVTSSIVGPFKGEAGSDQW